MERKKLFIIIGCSLAIAIAVIILVFSFSGKEKEIPAFVKCGDKFYYQEESYRTVQIDGRCWMKENLKAKNYRDNSQIANLTSNAKWSVNASGAYACYQNSEENCRNFGALYNWQAVMNPAGLCPEGWSVPTSSQWLDLQNSLCQNECQAEFFSVFSPVLSGFRNPSGPFFYLEEKGFWWTATLSRELVYAWMIAENQKLYQLESSKASGYSVRCIKDI